MYIITFIFVIIRLIILFFYIRIRYSAIIFNYIKNKWFKIYIKNKYFLLINFFSFISITGIILRTLFFY